MPTAKIVTELELFKSWLDREGTKYREQQNGNYTDIIIHGQYTSSIISFRTNGEFALVASEE